MTNLNFDSLSAPFKNMLLANDYRVHPESVAQWTVRKQSSEQRRLNADGQSTFGRTREQLAEDLERDNVETVEEQKRLLLLQFYEVINEINQPRENDEEEVGSPEIAKLLTSYLQHLEYIYEKETRFGEAVPPVVYNYKIDENIGAYCDSPPLELPPESFLREEDDSMVDLFDEYNANRLGLVNSPEEPDGTSGPARKSRKLFFGNHNGQNQSQWQRDQQRQQEQSVSFVKTEVYAKGPTDIPIEDIPDVYQRQWRLDAESLKNMHDMIQLLEREYEKIFEPALKLNNRLKTAVYEEDSKLTIEDYDQIKEMAKAVVNVGNQYKAIANQIISSFSNHNPDMNFFLELYKMDSMTHQINSLRSEARVGQIGEDHAVERVVNQLRESYFHAISHAKDAERIFDNFAFR